MIVSDLLTRAKKVTNYIVDATDNAAGNAKWDSTTVQTYTVPTGKRWFLLPSLVILDANATVTVYSYNVSDELEACLAAYAAGTGQKVYPSYTQYGGGTRGTILDAGDYIKITCGAAQGVGAKASCVVLEIDA